MSLQPAVQPRSSVNGFSRRRVEKDVGARIGNKFQPGQSNPNSLTGFPSENRSGSRSESPPRDRLVYLTTCLIGHQVDVQVKNGSIYSGILHASNAKMDFGIVLKMAHLTKDTSGGGPEAASESVNKASSETLIIPAHELVQVVAKDVPVIREGINIELALEKQDLLLDSNISKTRQVDGERELKPWVPDGDVPQNADLDNTFTSRWTSRSWDQFQVNEQLFGVKSTFNEELYTTKLERGPRTRELEQEAMRIAREIEGEETDDLHLAEERGIYSHRNIDVDEETRYSSVFRRVDDSGYEDEDAGFDTRNTDTFGESSELATGSSFTDMASRKADDGDRKLASTSSLNEIQSYQQNVNREPSHSGSFPSEHSARCGHAVEPDFSSRIQEEGEDVAYSKDSERTEVFMEEHETTITENLEMSMEIKEDSLGKVVSPEENADSIALRQEKASSPVELPEDATSWKVQVASQPKSYRGRPSSSVSSTSEGGGAPSASSVPALSPSSSVGSLTSEKSTLNPNAKEFKLNPNARSFVPSQAQIRPMPPVAESSFYYPANIPAMPHMPGMPLGFGIGPVLPGPQQMMFNPQGAPMQAPQTYYPANQPQFGQHMMMGHPRQVMYMPAYPSMGGQQEMPYTKGRDF